MYATEEGARRYEAALVPLMFAPMARRLVAQASPAPDARVLDIATGTGIVARTAAQAAPRGYVTAFDANPSMIAVARSTPAAPGATPIDYILSSMEETSLPAAAFDDAFCQQGLQFFEDPISALGHVCGWLKAGGRLHVALWGAEHANPFTVSLQNALRACGLDEFTGFLARVHHLNDPQQAIALLERGGFRVEQHLMVDLRPDDTLHPADAARLLAATPLAAKLASLETERHAALVRSLEGELARHAVGDMVIFHLPANLYTARVVSR